MTEHGAVGDGFSIVDAELADMCASYSQSGHVYYVVETDQGVLGGSGIGPLVGADAHICELKKMYFRPELRGLGIGREMLDICLRDAVELGYRVCYLETLFSMSAARKLYRAAGFEPIPAPLGKTGHHGCDSWMTRTLEAFSKT